MAMATARSLQTESARVPILPVDHEGHGSHNNRPQPPGSENPSVLVVAMADGSDDDTWPVISPPGVPTGSPSTVGDGAGSISPNDTMELLSECESDLEAEDITSPHASHPGEGVIPVAYITRLPNNDDAAEREEAAEANHPGGGAVRPLHTFTTLTITITVTRSTSTQSTNMPITGTSIETDPVTTKSTSHTNITTTRTIIIIIIMYVALLGQE